MAAIRLLIFGFLTVFFLSPTTALSDSELDRCLESANQSKTRGTMMCFGYTVACYQSTEERYERARLFCYKEAELRQKPSSRNTESNRPTLPSRKSPSEISSAKILFEAGIAAMGREDYDKALELFSDAAKLDPGNPMIESAIRISSEKSSGL